MQVALRQCRDLRERAVRATSCIALSWALLVLGAGTLAAAQRAADEVPREATVTADRAHVRSGPGNDYYPTQTLRRGDIVDVVAEDGPWCRIRPPAGSFSWVPAEALGLRDDGTARVALAGTAAGVGSQFDDQRDAVQVQLDRDEVVNLFAGQPESEEQAWIKISPPAGEYRWIHERHLRFKQTTARPGSPNRDGQTLRQVSYEESLPEPRLLNSSDAQMLDVRGSSSIAAVLDRLELGVAAYAAGDPGAGHLADIAADAELARRRAATDSERNRAEILVRRTQKLQQQARGAQVSTTSAAVVTPESLGLGAVGGAVTAIPSAFEALQTGGLIGLAQYMTPGGMGPGAPGCAPPVVAGPPMMAPYANPMAPPYSLYAPTARRHYVNLDALGWWVQKDQLPALVTTSPAGTPQGVAGVLGQPGTSVLYGNTGVNGNVRPGGRIQGGIWVVDGEVFALEGHYYALTQATSTFSAASTFSGGSTADPILARPFFNDAPGTNQQAAVLIAYPNFTPIFPPIPVPIDGSITVKETSRIQSAGGGGRLGLNNFADPSRFFLLAGYRYFNLNEGFLVTTTSFPSPGPFALGTRLASFDNFSTNNIFNGGDIGIAAEGRGRRWSLGAEGRVSLGNMNESLVIQGASAGITDPISVVRRGDLLTQPSNIGSYSRNVFAYIPQVDVKLGYQLVPAVRLTVGYNFTWVSRVLRPGAQIDTTVNSTQFTGSPPVGPASPAVLFNDSSMWLQGVTAGFDLTF